jgi:hypothetical protein
MASHEAARAGAQVVNKHLLFYAPHPLATRCCIAATPAALLPAPPVQVCNTARAQ